MIDVRKFRHQKEGTYLTVSRIVGGLLWLVIIVGTMGGALIGLLLMAFFLWISQQFFKAVIYGNAVRVNADQYADLNEIVRSSSAELGITEIPDVFVVNGQGAINAAAVRFLSKKYVLLFSDLVDLMLLRNETGELSMIINHELAHHAAGHTSAGRNLLIAPAKFIPFLGAAYSRACEFTADRIGYELTGDGEASKRALISVASGSQVLASNVDIAAFKMQETDIPPIFGFLHEIFGSHPRMTKRILELEKA